MAPVTPTQLPHTSKLKTNAGGFITGGLKKTVYVSLIKERDQLTQELVSANKQACESNQTSIGLTKQIENLTKTNAEANKEIDELTESVKEKNQTITELNTLTNSQAEDIKRLQHCLDEAVKSLKDGGKFAKSEQSKDIKSKVWCNIKDRHYRTIKFVRDAELTNLGKMVYADIKDNIKDDGGNPFVESEFLRIYESYVQEALGARRQYTQTQLQDAFVGKSLKCV